MSCFTTALSTALVGIRIHLPLGDGQSHPFLGLLLIVIGLLNLCKPEEMWYLSRGWQFKDAEPSEDAILWGRVSGVICLVIGIFLLF